MYGGGQGYLSSLKKGLDVPNIRQTKIKTKSISLINNNQIKTLNTKNSSADYLIEYFEGMILNYINLAEERGEKMDELKNLILSHKKDKFKGGNNSYLDNDPEYKNYIDDLIKTDVNTTDVDITLFDDNNWGYIFIEVHIDYQKEYYIHITHENNGLNKIDLIIDLQHNAIVDKANRLRNDDISTNTKNITYILENITTRLMKYDYNNTLISLKVYDSTKILPTIELVNVNSVYIRGIISLLIMILTLKNNVSKDVYKKYNTTFLLYGICKYQLLKDSPITDYNNSLILFSGNNHNILTYCSKDHMMSYGGDCALNVLMCVKNEDIRKLFVDKISYGQKNKTLNIVNDANNYVKEIGNVLAQMNTYQLEGFDLIDLIRNYVDEYSEFISWLDNNYLKFKQEIETNNYTTLPQVYKDCFGKIHDFYLKFAHVLRNNLFDYELTPYEASEMCDDISNDIIKVNNLLQPEIQNKTYDFTLGARKFITIMDKYMNFKNSFCIFYINLLISLLLIQHKIDYIFDEDIINVLKHTNDKINIIKCFKNIHDTRNEEGIILPMYQQGYGNDKYIFKYALLHKIPHVVFYIIDVSTPIKKIYLCDINNLDICYSEDFRQKYYQEFTNDFKQYYGFDNYPQRWIKIEMNNIEKYYCSDIWTYFENIKRITNLYYDSSLFEKAIIDSLNLNNKSVFKNDGHLDFVKLLTLDDADYDKNNFNYTYNIKRQIFDELVDYPNTIKSPNVDINFLNAVKYISDFVQNNIIKEESCGTKKLLFKFIECLIGAKWIFNGYDIKTINLDDEYKNIKNYFDNISKKYFDDIYHLADTQEFVNYLSFKDNKDLHVNYNNKIANILNILIYKFKNAEIVKGGYSNINYNNSIIKKILIILLVIVIIIIIVLIVLFIINKYNNNFK